jgi:hypothetical protein
MWRPTPVLALSFALLGAIAACGDNNPPINGTPPAAPAQNDPAFTTSALKHWYLVGDGVTPGDDTLTMGVTAPAGTGYVDAWIGTLPGIRLSAQDGQFVAQTSIADLPPGDYQILFAADGADTAYAAATIHRSKPYYFMMSTDWDFSDPGDPSLASIDTMHAMHPGLLVTDFVGPYTFTDPAVTAARAAQIATKLEGWRDTYGDELGLHIHPYCNFVTHAGLACIIDQSTVYKTDPSGYTIEVAAYGRDNFGVLLDDAAALFEANGLGHPKTFRAGGWTASLDTVAELAAKGYIADSSALIWARIEEWIGQGTGVLYNWNMTNWAPIGDTSQPWYPNHDVVLDDNAPQLPILEVPVNGVMADYVSTDEMTTIFNEIWAGGGALSSPKMLIVGFHPSTTYTSTTGPMRISGILEYVEQYLATNDQGPVVYTTLSAVVPAFSSAID